MADRAKIEALIERVEKLDGPDRETDARVDAVLAGRIVEAGTYLPANVPCLLAVNPDPPHDAYVAWCAARPGLVNNPPLTASLDAVLALAERVLPEALWQVKSGFEYSALVWWLEADWEDRPVPFGHHASSAAIALLLALLRALAAKGDGE